MTDGVNHKKFVNILDEASIDLVIKRDESCNGSWEEARKRVPISLLSKINLLQDYEHRNQVNLGAYVREYLSGKQP